MKHTRIIFKFLLAIPAPWENVLKKRGKEYDGSGRDYPHNLLFLDRSQSTWEQLISASVGHGKVLS